MTTRVRFYSLENYDLRDQFVSVAPITNPCGHLHAGVQVL